MKKFRFRFTVVMDQRKEEERQALLLFAHKQRVYQNELLQKDKLLGSLQAALQRRENLGVQAASVHDFQAEQNFIEGTKQRMLQADYRIMRAYRDLEKTHLRYLDARKRTKMIQVLKEKDEGQFKKDRNKKETKDLEDLMIMRFRLKEEVA